MMWDWSLSIPLMMNFAVPEGAPRGGSATKNSKNLSLPCRATEKTLMRGDNRKYHDLHRILPVEAFYRAGIGFLSMTWSTPHILSCI
jgi:hypothetical protein